MNYRHGTKVEQGKSRELSLEKLEGIVFELALVGRNRRSVVSKVGRVSLSDGLGL